MFFEVCDEVEGVGFIGLKGEGVQRWAPSLIVLLGRKRHDYGDYS